MMSSDSTLYTIGTALHRAQDGDVPVQILVEGQWMSGDVLAVDGHGVVINSEDREHSVIRMSSVSAVRVFCDAPFRPQLDAALAPMPTPRFPVD